MSILRFNHNNQGIRNLALSIIVDSIEDYLKPVKIEILKKRKSSPLQNKDEAISFLFGDGTWKESRENWCEVAGICPEKLSRVKTMDWEGFKRFKREVFGYKYKDRLRRQRKK